MGEAEDFHRRAIGLLAPRTYGDDPEGTDCRQALAESYANLGSVRAMAGDMVDAGRWLQEAIPIFEALAGSRPGNTSFRQALGNLGTLQSVMGQAQEAPGSFRRAVEIQEPLAREHPSVVEFQQDLAKAYTDLGSALEATDKDEAARSYQHSIEALEPMARTYPQVVSIRQDLARGLLSLAALRIDSGQWRAALPSLERALAIEEPLAREHPDDPESRRYLSVARIGLGKVRAASGQPAEALKHWQEAVGLIESFREPMNYDLYNLSCAYALSGSAIEKIRVGAQTGGGPTAKDLLDRAMDALRRAVAAGWGDVRAMENDDLKPLRSREDYRALIARVRSQ